MNLEFEECLKKQKIKKFSRGESYPCWSKEGAEKLSESAEMFLKKAKEILKEKLRGYPQILLREKEILRKRHKIYSFSTPSPLAGEG